MKHKAKVVIIGGGFGGLQAAKALKNEPVNVTLIDRKNHHTFQPLLYQVATAVLSPGEIASPINVGAGCRFASRCPKVMEVCRSVTPKLRPLADAGGGQRQVACHLFDGAKSA